MITQLSHQRTRPGAMTRQAGARLGRIATLLGVAISGLLASIAAATAAFAQPIPVGEDEITPVPLVPHPTVRVVTTGGIPGWQIILIALGAWPPQPRPYSWTGSWPAAAAPAPPPPDAPTHNRTPRLPDDGPPA